MQFNPTDKSNSIIGDIDFLLFSDSSSLNTAYSLIDRTRSINLVYDEVITEFFKSDPNWKWDDTNNTNIPVATTELVASQENYSIIDSGLVIHRIRVLDQNGKYKTLNPKIRGQLSDSDLDATGTPDSYFRVGNAIRLVPLNDYGASEGLEIEIQRGASYFSTSDTNKSPGFNPQFHQILSIGAALRYAIANNLDKKIAQLRADKIKMFDDIERYYQLRSQDVKPRMTIKRKSVNYYGLN